MWSSTRKALENRLADCLKERVYYSCAVYDVFPETVFYIRVDNKTWFATSLHAWYNKAFDYSLAVGNNRIYGETMATNETGTVGDIDLTMKMIHNYLNVYTIEECWNQENYFYHILAVLDRRTGKRKIKKLLENIDNEPEWFRKYITLRAEAQNIRRKNYESIND